jgi:hypothetical protein
VYHAGAVAAGEEAIHLTDAGPVSTGAPSVVQEEGGSDLTRGQGDVFADTCAQIAMIDFLKSCRPSRPGRPVRPGSQGAGITLVHSLSVAGVQFIQLSQALCHQVGHEVRHHGQRRARENDRERFEL